MLIDVSRTCRAWFALCEHDLYRELSIQSSCVSELVKTLDRLDNHIARHTEVLRLRGFIPWTALPKLVAKLPCLRQLEVAGSGPVLLPRLKRQPSARRRRSMKADSRRYHPTLLRLCSVNHAFKTSVLTALSFTNVWFPSTSDVLEVLAFFPRLAPPHPSRPAVLC